MEAAPLCDPRHTEAGILRGSSLCHHLGPARLEGLVLGREACYTNRAGNDATGLLLLETWDLPLVVPYEAFGVMAMQFKFN